ncbi:FAD-binding protein [Sedimentibacter saalensis]|uniref:Flavin-dependent dehydrogenase n=1 Tax=Sedimentibacter saalensis TaxID=130788 RepID=A0A562JBR7_9FIRM|nr:FAD-binding protein [Sedimentibacter saalensis]TWH80661.1 flavin-dependent dehydrogenase [Sedimentibacter saalensis]
MYDIVIVGSGPAGANLARLIGDKYKVLLIDKRDLENENHKNTINKCCGGLLAPDAQKMIAKLGLGVPKDILVDPQLFAVRTIDLTNNLERLYQRFYHNMDREKFDRWLISLLPTGVDKKFNSFFKSFTKTKEGYEIKYIYNGLETAARTKVIVGADGALSNIRKSICYDKNFPERYISIQEWYECQSTMPYFTAIFDTEISNFYSWVIPKNKCLLLGSALKPGDNTREKYNLLKAKLTQLGFNFGNKLKTEGAFINRPMKISQFYAGRDCIALVGEAAGAISPSSAEGISYALKSSLYLAESLEDGIDGFLNRYEQKVKDIKLNLLIKNLKSPAMFNPFLRNFAMKSGFQSLKQC